MKRFTLLTIALLLSVMLFAQKSYVNPTAKYAEMLGYRYEIATQNGGEVGMVHLPDGRKVNAWDFYKGKVAKEFTYAAKLGFDIETEVIEKDGYTIERAVCVRSNKGEEERIPLLDLMELNGEPLIAEVPRKAPTTYEMAKSNPDFTVSKSLPTEFDWRNYNGHAYIGDPRDQGSCGSCYSFGAAAAAEGAYNVATGSIDNNTADFSEAYIAFCLSNISPYSSHFDGCNGADYEYYELQALVDIGIIDESYFPYTDANNQSCPSTTASAPKTKFESWHRVASSDVDAIKTAIMTYGVVDAAVYVTTSFSNYSGGIWSDSNNSCSNGAYTTTNHAIALVGWGHDATEGDYWILRNSWGSSWGEGGYMRIAVNSAAVDCAVCYMVYDNVPQAPVAAFSANETTVLFGNSVSFTDASTNSPTSWSWSFEGGTPSTSTSQNPTVVYNTPGTYNVTLTATNAQGSDVETKTNYITVLSEIIPEYCASAGNNASYEWIAGVEVGSFTNTSGSAKYTDFTGMTANLEAGQTYNITLTPGFASTTYDEYWKIWIDLNRDGDFDDANENVFDQGGMSKTAVTGTITIPAGTSEVTTRMRVTMKYNGEPTACENTFSYGEVEDYTVYIGEGGVVTNEDPVAVINGPYTGTENLAVAFSSAGTYDPDGTIASYLWNFGDGSTSTSANPSHTYAAEGTYTVTLTVTDNDNATDNAQTTATIVAGGTGGDVELAYSDFESGFGIWTDGGGDCMLYTGGTRAYEGNNAINIQDNSGVASSFYLTNGIDVHNPGFVQVEVEFYFYAYSMDNSSEDFWVQYYDGSAWNTVATYARTTDFDNNTFYVTTVTIDEANYTFPTGMKIRFMCDASGNQDDVYIDNVKITGKTTRTVTNGGNVSITKLHETGEMELDMLEDDQIRLYPNPVKSDLTVMVPFENVTMKIVSITGAVLKEQVLLEKENQVNVSELPNGVYMIYVEAEDGPIVERFIKQ